MKSKKRNAPRSLIFALVLGAVFWAVWSKVRIWISISLTPLQAILFFSIVVVGLFLVIEHFVNRER